MNLRRENVRTGWLILSRGRPWDDWVYSSEAAALATVKQCGVADATVIQSQRPGHIQGDKQYSERMLFDRKRIRR